MVHVGHVDAARQHVGRHQDADAVLLKAFQRLAPLRLRKVRVDGLGAESCLAKLLRHFVAGTFRAHEDDGAHAAATL